MKMKVREKFRSIVAGMKNAFINAPLAMILCGMIGCLALILHHLDVTGDLSEYILRGVLVCILGIPFSMMTLQIAHNISNVTVRVALWILLVAFLVLYYFYGIPVFTMKTMTRLAGVTLLSTVAYVLCYGSFNKIEHEKMSLYVFKRILFTGVYALVIWGGISFTFFAFSELMDINLWDEAYIDFLFVTLGFIIPPYFFSAFPKEKSQLPEISSFVTTLISYILIPVILAYTAVLYLYFIKLLISFQWPEGMLGHLVFWYGLVSTAVMFFLLPFSKDKKMTDTFYRYFPFLIIIPLVMMFISLAIRIQAYGFTEPRYWVGIMGFWIFLSMCTFLLRSRFKNVNKTILIYLVITCLVSVAGPFNAYAVSLRSQNRQFQMLNDQYDFFSETKPFRPEDMNEEDREKVVSIIRYFDNNHTLDDINVPEHIQKESLRYMFNPEHEQPPQYININATAYAALDIQGYDLLLSMYENQYTVESNDGTPYQFTIENGMDFIIYSEEREIYRKDVGEFIVTTYQEEIQNGQSGDKPLDKRSFDLPASTLIYHDINQLCELRFYIQNAFCRLQNDGTIKVESMSFYTAIKWIE